MKVDVSNLTDAEILRRQKELPENRSRIDNIYSEMKDLLKSLKNNELVDEIKKGMNIFINVIKSLSVH